MIPTYIGGTDVASILGLPAYRAPWATWLRFTRGTDDAPSERMNIGNLLEPVVLDEYRRRCLGDLQEIHFPPGRPAFIHTEHVCLAGTPDLLHLDVDGRLVVVDAKVTQVRGLGKDGQEADLDAGDVPAQWWAQVHHYAWICSRALDIPAAPEARIWALLAGAELRLLRVPLMLDWWEAEAVPRLLDFWACVELGIAPKEPEPVEIKPIPTIDADTAADDYLQARECIDMWTERKAAARARIDAAIVAAGLPARSVTASASISCYTTHAGPTLDRAGLERDHPDLVQRYMLPGAPRREIRVRPLKRGKP